MASYLANTNAWSLYFNITEGCNNACSFCASNSPNQNKNIPTETICENLDKYHLDPRSLVVINGGEPTTHPGIKHILDRAIKTGARVILFTNGRRLSSKNFIDGIDWHSLYRLSIPIYSAKQDLHDQLVGKSGAWNQTIRGLKNINLLREASLGPVELEIKLLSILPSLPGWSLIVDEIIKMIKPPERVVLSGLILSKTLLLHNQELIPEIEELFRPLNETVRKLRSLKIKFVQLWSIPWCLLDEDNFIFFTEQNRAACEFGTEKIPIKELYFDHSCPDGIELKPQQLDSSKNEMDVCRKCKIDLPCDGMPAFMLSLNQ